MADRVLGLPYNVLYKGIALLIEQNSPIVPNIVGHGGIGKSQLVRELAKSKGYGFYEITCSLLQPGDLTMPVPKETQIKYYLNPQIQQAIDEANRFPQRKVILFLDEFNRPVEMVQGELMNLVLQRNLMGNDLPDNIVIITAENPSSDVEGFENTAYATNARDLAINDRTMRLRMGTSVDNWLQYFASRTRENGKPQIHKLVQTFLEKEGRQYFIVVDETRDKNPTPRAYERLSYLLYHFEDTGYSFQAMQDDEMTAFLIEGIDGCIGEEAGQVFLGFLQNQQGDYIEPQEIAHAHGQTLASGILERYQEMDPVRRKRVLEDLTDYYLGHSDLIQDKAAIERYAQLFEASDPDIIYYFVDQLIHSKPQTARAQFKTALYQNERFIAISYSATMAINQHQEGL